MATENPKPDPASRADTTARPERDPAETSGLGSGDSLRSRAEKHLDVHAPVAPTPEDPTALIQELRVHQIELEMQNEELRRAQLELDAQRERYFDLFDLAPVGYLTIDEGGLVSDANVAAARHLGVERLTLVGQPFSAFVFLADRDAYYLHHRALQRTGEVQTCELRLNRFNGVGPAASTPSGETPVPFWAHLESRPGHTAAEGTPSTWVTFTDVEERKRADNALVREQSLLSQAESIAHIGSWRVGLQTGDRRWSEEAARILGFDPSSSKGDAFDAFRAALHPDDVELFLGWARSASMGDGPMQVDFRILLPDGEARWITAFGAREKGPDGEPVALAGILQDVTDRKRDEEERVSHLEQVANVDRLTGLHNLRGFELVAEQTIALARRAGQGIGLIFGDMDGLKTINDSFGHLEGDRALRDVASILEFSLRDADVIARIGGDEFIVLAVADEEPAVHVLNGRLQKGFEFFNMTSDRPFQLAMSSGVAWGEPAPGCLADLRMRADTEMYIEKQRRRDCDVG